MPGYGARYWAERTAHSRRTRYPPLVGEHTADVVVIGGGLTGTTAAYVLARGGLKVILLEGDRLAGGGTSAGLGTIVPEAALSFRPIEASLGGSQARRAWEAARGSALDMAAALRRLKVRCDLEPAPLVISASSAEAAGVLRREQVARKARGMDAAWITARAAGPVLGSEVAGALKVRDAFVFDPVRAALGMARAAESAGVSIHEKAVVRRTSHTRNAVEILLAKARVSARGVFVATDAPGPLFRPLLRHVRLLDAYAVVTEPLSPAMKRETGRHDCTVLESGESPRWLRWLDDGRALFAGAAGPATSARSLDRTLIQRTGQLMYELSLRHPVMSGLPARWSWPIRLTTAPDGLPWIGTHRNYPFHYFALALGWHGDGLAWFAAKSALRHFTNRPARGDDAFGFGR